VKHQEIVITAFVILCLAQAAVPLSMIGRREYTLRHGRVYRFRTAPVDPYDAFRGRYVALRMQQRTLALERPEKFTRHQEVFVRLKEDEQGYALIDSVSADRPAEEPYIKARVHYQSRTNLHIRWPFDRYYMNEADAPEAERVYREHSRRGKQEAHINVRVSSGFAVLEELYIADKPILEFMAGAGQE